MALPDVAVETTPATMPAAHLRRCWFRRLTRVEAAAAVVYEVQCLVADRQAVPIGDLEIAREVCNACRAPGVFRPDEE